MKRLLTSLARAGPILVSFLFVIGLYVPGASAGFIEIETADVELEATRLAAARGAEGQAFLRLRTDGDDGVLRVRATAEGLEEEERFSLWVESVFIDSDISDEDGDVFFRGVRDVFFDELEDLDVLVREGRRGAIVLRGRVDEADVFEFEEEDDEFFREEEEEEDEREREDEEEEELREEEEEEREAEEEEREREEEEEEEDEGSILPPGRD